MITIKPLKNPTKEDLRDLNAVLEQLRTDPKNHHPVSAKRLRVVLKSRNQTILVVRDKKKIIGTGTIVWEDILTGRDGSIEDVVVDNSYRGRGLGAQLVRALIAIAKKSKVATIYLTSRPSRIAANKLYPKLGFVRKETNNYEMDL
jgi:ribosomal protein S18 acetylase RimI-like enzyme